jgi:ornithine carbamoyltransferase
MPTTTATALPPSVIDGPQSAVWRQAANRLPTEQALLSLLTQRTEDER